MSTPTAPSSPAVGPEVRGADENPASDFARPPRPRWLLIVAALVGGAIGWQIAAARGNPFPTPAEMQGLLTKRGGAPLSEEEAARLDSLETSLAIKNSAATLAMIAVPLGAAFGLAGGFLGRSWLLALAGPLAGALLAGVAAGVAGWLGVLVYSLLKTRVALDATYAAMAAYVVIWAVIAVPAALLTWLGLRRDGVSLGRLIGAGLVGALAAALLYPVVAAIAFPMSNTELLVPEDSWNLLIWAELAAGLIAAALVPTLRTPREARPAPPQAATA